jgi:hypothetical protein
MRTSLRIDFGPPARHASLAGISAIVVAAGLCGAALLDYHATAADVESLAQAVSQAQRAQERRKHAYDASPPVKLTPRGIAAINRVVTQLNLPWGELFSVFEAKTLPTVALLSLEPDSQKQLLKITAEAKTPEDMVIFFESLQAESKFPEVVLTKHEVNEQDPNRPIRFALEVHWRTAE